MVAGKQANGTFVNLESIMLLFPIGGHQKSKLTLLSRVGCLKVAEISLYLCPKFEFSDGRRRGRGEVLK